MPVFLLVLIVVLLAILIFAATRPDNFSVQRAATINAPPEKIFEFLDDFRRWTAWSPWEALDPDMVRTYGGPDSGPGATYEWSGNKKVGRGRMEIIESVPPSRLTLQLDFVAPFEAHNVTVFTLDPGADGTVLTWEMRGPSTFMSKLMGLFVSMDRMIGRDFERGLANLKAAAER